MILLPEKVMSVERSSEQGTLMIEISDLRSEIPELDTLRCQCFPESGKTSRVEPRVSARPDSPSNCNFEVKREWRPDARE